MVVAVFAIQKGLDFSNRKNEAILGRMAGFGRLRAQHQLLFRLLQLEQLAGLKQVELLALAALGLGLLA